MLIVCARCAKAIKSRGEELYVCGPMTNTQHSLCDVCKEDTDEMYFVDKPDPYDADLEPD